MAQKFCDFSTLWGSKGPAEAGAFQGGGGGREPQRARQVLVFGDGERERAVEHVACAQRIHGMYGKGGRLLQLALLVEPDRASRAAGSREERGGQLRDLLERFAVVRD